MQTKSNDPSDEQLLERVHAGDSGALGLLYVRYSPRVCDFALQFSGDEKEAEDITHNVFCRLWERRELIVDIESLKAYLFKMTRNEILTLFRHRRVERNYLKLRMEEEPPEDADATAHVTTKELVDMIDLAIERMPELRRRIFLMSRYDEMTYAEIAARLDISPRTVQYHIGKALADLRKLLNILMMFV
ncbi:RNA polymerase sigma-70 factor [uncultured Muribaculum sp.]|uniref:RNA polymerase sigma-70 factor n=1 Tax=uncultured Muribaculum sp. TaxID=1918613 RepID=UPI0025EAD920|nr:RNA polymerase sigma-70 factor [uncultured Muribaculum sp.]